MSDVGLLATQLANTTKCAEDLDRALLSLRKEGRGTEGPNLFQAKEIIKQVLTDLIGIANNDLSPKKYQFREETVEILREIHRADWQSFIEKLGSITKQLGEQNQNLNLEQFGYLEDIAYALDTECSKLFQSMQGRHR